MGVCQAQLKLIVGRYLSHCRSSANQQATCSYLDFLDGCSSNFAHLVWGIIRLSARLMRIKLLSLSFLLLVALPVLGLCQGKPPTREVPFVPPKRWALVIGASNYAELGKLKYAAEDAKFFAKTLVDRFGYQPDAIELITDEPGSTVKPDAKTISEALDRQLADKRLQKGDLFIFYFSGHGIGTAKGDYLLSTDATKANGAELGMPVSTLTKRLVDAGLRNVLIIADACRGGEKNDFGNELWELARKANLAVLLGCQPGERSYEYPNLGHGIFTYQLVQALKDKELCNPVSGAMWASKVAERVSEQVHSYTERDYAEHAQRPRAWAEKTSDVLLGAFPSRVAPNLAIAELQREGKSLGVEKLAESLSLFGIEAFANDDDLAIESLKAVDGLALLDPPSRYVLGLALARAGRQAESERQFATLAQQDESPLYKQLAILFNPSRTVAPQQRVVAARSAWELEPREYVARLAWASMTMYGSPSDAHTFLKELLDLHSLEPRFHAYLEGFLAAESLDWAGALKKWESAEKLPGETPTMGEVLAMKFVGLVNSGRQGDLESFLKTAAEKDPDGAASWNMLRAGLLKERHKNDEMVAAVKQALATKVTDEQLLWSVRLAGLRFPQIASEVVSKADEMPYAWRAKLAKLWVTKLDKGPEVVTEALSEAMRYCDDEFTVLFECYRLLDGQLDETLERGLVSKEKYSQLMLAYSQSMAQNVDKFGFEAEAWLLFNKFALMSEKFEQLNALYELKLGKYADDGTLAPTLRMVYLIAALSIGNDKRASRMMELGGFHPADQIDAGWVYAAYLALNGKTKEARPYIPRSEPSEDFRPFAKALLAYLDVKAGKPVDLVPTLAAVKSFDGARQLIGLAYAAQGKWKQAEPILKEALFARQLGLFFVQAKVVQTYFDRMIALGRFSEAADIACKVQISGFGNPLYRKIHFGQKPGLAGFAGTIRAQAAQLTVPEDVVPGSIELTIDGKGHVSGKAVINERVQPVTGTVDPYGNLAAAMTIDGKPWRMSGKLAQPSVFKKLPQIVNGVQVFLLLDPNGQCLFLALRP